MEVYARTGAEVINDEIEKAYLKTKIPEPLRIKFDHIITVENDNFGRDRNYFMGIEMPKVTIEPKEDSLDDEK